MQEIVDILTQGIEEDKKQIDTIKKVIETCFQEENLQGLNFYITITLTVPEKIKELNRMYRNIDKETDVLSFPMFERKEIEQMIQRKEKQKMPEVLGDIVISIPQVHKQAQEYGHSFERELAYMLVHGFYHLMGYDHIEEKDKLEMRPKEEKILTKLHITRENSN